LLRKLTPGVCRKEAIDRDGVVVPDRFGALRTHPAHAVERDSRAAFLQALRQLGFEQPQEQPGPMTFDARRRRAR
jgi:hypothetical protein